MCTVTVFFEGVYDFIITSSRDESPGRVSLHPAVYEANGMRLLFPKDELSGGTWFGVGSNKRLLCLLNGGFNPHERKANYRKSRGLVVKELLLKSNIKLAIEKYNFVDIEPFTLISIDWKNQLHIIELVWDGEKSHLKQYPLDNSIWSSSTLYSETMKNERKKWFESLKLKTTLDAEDILNFHKQSQNSEYGLVMDRGLVKTTSITQVLQKNDEIRMTYLDFIKNKTSVFNFNSALQLNE